MNTLTLSLVEAAEALGLPAGVSGRLGKQRVYREVLAGRIRGVRIGREIRVPVTEIERLVGGSKAVAS